MATYSQDAQRLVIVAKTAVAGPDPATIAGAANVGKVGIVNPDVKSTTALIVGDKFKILFNTNKSPVGSVIGATNPLHLVSETIDPKNIVNVIAKAYKAPVMPTATIAVGTAVINNEYYVTVDLDGYGSTSAQNTLQVYGVYLSKTGDDAQAIADGLRDSLNKNVSRAGAGRVKAYTATAASNPGGLAGPPLADGTAGTAPAANTIVIAAELPSVINFNNPFSLPNFRVYLNGTFGTGSGLTEKGGTKGIGYGPEVANIEHFAQGSEANWTWLNYPEMYPRDLYTDPTKNYDVVSIRYKTVNEGFGSNISSFRQVDVFAETGSGAFGSLSTLTDVLETLTGLSITP